MMPPYITTPSSTITNQSTDSNITIMSEATNSPPAAVMTAAAAAATAPEAKPPNGIDHLSGVNSTPGDVKQASADSPPPQIVSDVADPSMPSTAPAPTPLASQHPSSSTNRLNDQVLQASRHGSGSSSRGASPRHPPPSARSSPSTTTVPAQPQNGSSVARQAATPSQTRPHPRAPTHSQASLSTPAKIPIIDVAPGTGTASPAPSATSGFPSPGKESFHQNIKFKDDRTRITFSIRQALSEAVRRSVRDDWEKCLLGSEFHQAFVVSSCPVPSVRVGSAPEAKY